MPAAKALVLSAEMEFDMQDEAVNLAAEAVARCTVPEEVPGYIKQQFDRKHNAPWHCVVGKNFYSYFTYEIDKYIFFNLRGQDFLLYKTPA
ncbi:Dynein light chain motor [Fasciolopsis buskii]|uniref:Dynein light chain n=1 Tax=Fasciolopsis buskii TaxID=27845 RepID=A0A8E0RUV6_9TREM|nr:Dynein light chain motor [Fasciolopsis buski]